MLGALAIPGAIGGVAIVNAIPERTVEVLFALLMLYVASQMVRRALAGPEARLVSRRGPSPCSSAPLTLASSALRR